MNRVNEHFKKVFFVVVVGIAALTPIHSIAANKLIVNGADGQTPAFVVSSTGNVGIGQANPYYPIQIAAGGPTSVTTLEFRNTGNLDLVNRASYDAPTVQLVKNNAPSINNGNPQDGDRLGIFHFGTFYGANGGPGGTLRYSASIEADAEGSSGDASSFPGYLSFQTTTYPNPYPSEKLRVTSGGNIGIGTGNPTQKLEINGGVRLNTSTAQPTPCDATVRGTIWFTQGGANVADTLQVCAKGSNDAYAWKSITLN